MSQIIPEGWGPSNKTGPLEINDRKFKEMVAIAKKLLIVPMSLGELSGALEQHCVKLNEHYTSSQLKKVVVQVAADLAPEVVEEKPRREVVKSK